MEILILKEYALVGLLRATSTCTLLLLGEDTLTPRNDWRLLLPQDHCQAAVTHVRSQTMAVRKTTEEYLRQELLRGEYLTNGDPKW